MPKKDFEDLKQELKQMKLSLKGSQTDFYKKSVEKIRKDRNQYPNDGSAQKNRFQLTDSLSNEVMTMKKKFSEFEVKIDSLQNGLNRVKKESKSKFNQILETVQTELETLKLFKDRISLVIFFLIFF